MSSHGGKSPSILDLGTECKWMINFALRPFYRRLQRHRYPLEEASGPQSRSDRDGEVKNQSPNEIRTPAV
jgi:hypothetical protein